MSEAWKNNTVEAKNQLKETEYVSFINPEGSPRFMFLGNSITRHAPRPRSAGTVTTAWQLLARKTTMCTA